MIDMRHCVRGAGVHNGGGRGARPVVKGLPHLSGEKGCPISSELSPPMMVDGFYVTKHTEKMFVCDKLAW